MIVKQNWCLFTSSLYKKIRCDSLILFFPFHSCLEWDDIIWTSPISYHNKQSLIVFNNKSFYHSIITIFISFPIITLDNEREKEESIEVEEREEKREIIVWGGNFIVCYLLSIRVCVCIYCDNNVKGRKEFESARVGVHVVYDEGQQCSWWK